MAKFCKYCGKPLQEGEVCTCRLSAAAQATQQPGSQSAAADGANVPPSAPIYQSTPNNAAPSVLTIFFQNVWACFKTFFADSEQVLSLSASRKDVGTGLFFAGVYTLLLSFAYMGIVGGIMRGIVGAFSSSLGSSSLNGLMVPATNSIANQIHLPYGGIFWLAFFLTACAYFGICGIGMLCALVSGTQTRVSYVSLLSSVGVSAIPSAVCALLALLFSFFWVEGAVFFVFVSIISWTVLSYSATRLTLRSSESKINIVFAVAISVLFAIILLISTRAIPSLLGGISYNGSKLGSLFSLLS